jgi:signal transduction histidine kinase
MYLLQKLLGWRVKISWTERLWRIFIIFLIVFVPVVITESVVAAWHVPTPEFYTLANDPAKVYYVIPGSGAEKAGVQLGDRILEANGLSFNANGLSQVIRHWYVGETLALIVQRKNNQVTSLVVPLAPVAATALDTIWHNTLVALVIWGSSLVLLRERFHHPEVRLLFLLAQAMALVLVFPPIQSIIWYHAHPTWINITGVGAFLSTALLLHFHSTFPVSLGNRRQRWQVFGGLYGLTLAAAGAWILLNSSWLPWWMASVLLSYMALVVIAAMVVLLYVYRRRAASDGRRRLRVILIANLIAGGSMAFLFILPLAIQGYPLGYPLRTDMVMLITLSAAPAAYVYATVRHNLFGIERLLNRALAYILIALAVFVLFAGLLLLLDQYLPSDWLQHTLIMSGLTLVVALAFEGTRRRVQAVVDRLFYGGWYDYPKVVELVSAALARSLDWAEFTEILTRQVPTLMQLRGAQLQLGEQVGMPQDIGLEPQLRFPLGGEGQPDAFWIVGSRRDGDELSATDRRILKTLARQANIALSNVRLVQTLRHQLDEILVSRKTLTHLQHQLLRMREAERQRLARDLHDGPIQTLVGLNIQLGMLSSRHEGGDAATPLACALNGMRDEVHTLLTDLRQVCADLRPPMLDTLGLGAALRALAEEWSAQHEARINLDLAPDAALQTLPAEVAVNLYRVVQEALSNVARHASARSVSLSLRWAYPGEELRLAIKDDGRGFAPIALARPTEHGHFGLAAMQERVALIGGRWQLESTLGQGTEICVLWFPPENTQAQTAKN